VLISQTFLVVAAAAAAPRRMMMLMMISPSFRDDDDDDFIKTGKYKQKARVKRDAQSFRGGPFDYISLL